MYQYIYRYTRYIYVYVYTVPPDDEQISARNI
jgi:hypothetical protein